MSKHRATTDLLSYFEERRKEGHAGEDNIIAESIPIISKSFYQTKMIMTSQCYRAIGMVMLARNFYEPGLAQFELSLQTQMIAGKKSWCRVRLLKCLYSSYKIVHCFNTSSFKINP
jgi:hypothetical protein